MKRPAIFEDLHHSFKRRKLSGSNLQEMVDHINIDLDDYDIEDYDRGLPAYIYDLSMLINANDLRGVSVCHMLIDRITRSSFI